MSTVLRHVARKEELIGRPIKDITHPDDYVARSSVPSSRRTEWKRNSKALHPGWIVIWVNHATSVARGRNGEPIHLITVAEDISERKQAEEQLTQLGITTCSPACRRPHAVL